MTRHGSSKAGRISGRGPSRSVLLLAWTLMVGSAASVAAPAEPLTAAEVAERFSSFVRARSEHLDGYAEPGSAAAGSLPEILADRERAIGQLEGFYDARLDGRLALVFFATEESKLQATGHRGWGWAVNDVIVEVRNAHVHLEPFHELSHQVSARLGTPPAIFDEGAAVYATARFGADPMADLGHPGSSLDEVVVMNIDSGRYVPLRELFAFTEIGSPTTQGEITYPQAGSFVAFLVSRSGEPALRTAFRRLQSSDDPDRIAENERAFCDIFGLDLDQAERLWRGHLGRPFPRPR